MNTIRLVRTPWALLANWRDRRRVQARIKWAQSDLDFLKKQTQLDAARIEFLRGHLEELRVQLASIKP